VFVTGGSQGAATLNELLAPILPDLTGRYFVLHQCGPGKLLRRTGLPGYLGVEFLGDELRDVYAASTLVVSRAGAGTITELRQYAVPAVRVPYPWARGNHQLENARLLARRGVCTVLLQDTLTPERLLRAIDEGVEMAPERRANYRDVLPSNALERIIAEVLAAASVRGNGRHDS